MHLNILSPAKDSNGHALSPASILLQIARSRGCESTSSINAFLNPGQATIPSWKDWVPFTKAADRLFRAISERESICLFCDYDTDGITSAAIMWRLLHAYGIDAHWYIPERASEDYGLTQLAAENCLRKFHPSLLISLDCGSSAVETIGSLDCDTIVIDHHHIANSSSSPAYAHLNPKAGGTEPDLSHAATAGLCWLFAQEFAARHPPAHQLCQSALTIMGGLGTLVDVVPLNVSFNRCLVRRALDLCNTCDLGAVLPGLSLIMDTGTKISSWNFAFQAGPILNAGGRMGKADDALRLLLARSRSEAQPFADTCQKQNRSRLDLQKQIMMEAEGEAIRVLSSSPDTKVIVIGKAHWHSGIVGIVAARLKDRYHRPVFVFGGKSTDLWKGSGRSVPGFDLGAAMLELKRRSTINAGGGHAMAAGATIHPDQIGVFRAGLQSLCPLSTDELCPSFEVIEHHPGLLERDWALLLSHLEPFGSANVRPSLLLPKVHLVGPPKYYYDQSNGSLKMAKLLLEEPMTGFQLQVYAHSPKDIWKSFTNTSPLQLVVSVRKFLKESVSSYYYSLDEYRVINE